ncbi:MAG: iron-containing alcohol dehydrogenase [Puniceicoccaceae bacterium]
MIPTQTATALGAIHLNTPAALWFGCGERTRLAEGLQGLGSRKAWILTADFCIETADTLATAFAECGIEAFIKSDLPAEPTVADFQAVCSEEPASVCDTIIGIGGGSVLDIAKLVAAIGDQPSRLPHYFGKNLLPERQRRLICLPTTAGAGSEASPNAILLEPASGLKQAVISPYLVPDLVVIDPELARSLPPAVTAATGFDALSHCIEAYTNLHAHVLVDAFALQGISLISSQLVAAIKDGNDLIARSALALGSYLGGLCLGPVNTAAVHALSYPVGSRYKVPHGLANAVLLAPVMRYNLPSATTRYAEVARAMGVAHSGTDMEMAEAAVGHIQQMLRDCSLETGLGSLGIPSEALPELADQALQVTRLLNNNPRPIDRAAAMSIYEEAF